MTPHANFEINQFKGTWLRMHEVVAARRLFFTFLGLCFVRIATGRPVGPIIAVNGSNDAAWWQLHSLYGFDYKNLNLSRCLPQNSKICIMAYGDFKRL